MLGVATGASMLSDASRLTLVSYGGKAPSVALGLYSAMPGKWH